MAPMDKASEHENTYIINAESKAEIHRLTIQDQMLTKEMGGLFPERTDLSTVHHVLDISCGPGQWALDMAYTHKHMAVVGIDLSEKMIAYANTRKLLNTEFLVMDALQPLDFPDATFDLINARLLFAFMPQAAWPKLLLECKRISSPNGIIRLTESESAITNSLSCERFLEMMTRSLYLVGQSFSPDGRQVGITPMLSGFLHDVGYQNIQQRAFAIDFSATGKNHEYMYQNLSMTFLLVQPFLIKLGLATEEELTQLYKQAIEDMQLNTFRAIWYYLTAWGEKPTRELKKN
ncbi:MAG: hypothetical protein NVS4B11_28880 [Ktedonobacteraceae bacterium]